MENADVLNVMSNGKKRISIVKDETFRKAVRAIELRAENTHRGNRSNEYAYNVSYYGKETLDKVCSPQTQLICGRRGTGKTNLLEYLEYYFNEVYAGKDIYAIYVDCKSIIGIDNVSYSLPKEQRNEEKSIRLLNALFKIIAKSLLDKFPTLYKEITPDGNSAIRNIAQLNTATETSEKAAEEGISAEGSLSLTPNIGGNLKNNSLNKTTQIVNSVYRTEIDFDSINHLFGALERQEGRRVVLLLDEWELIDLDVQPLFAHRIRLHLLTGGKLTIKIATVDEGSRLFAGIKGLQGSDEFKDKIDLDKLYIFEQDPQSVMAAFSIILYNQVKKQLPENYLSEKYDCHTSKDFISCVFQRIEALVTLIRVSGGNIRDLIRIFDICIEKINKPTGRVEKEYLDFDTICYASKKVYEDIKMETFKNDEDTKNFFFRLVDYVLIQNRTRGFFIPTKDYTKKDMEHNIWLLLLNARLLNIIDEDVATADMKNQKYHILTIDYGAILHTMANAARNSQEIKEVKNGLKAFTYFLFKRDKIEVDCAKAMNVYIAPNQTYRYSYFRDASDTVQSIRYVPVTEELITGKDETKNQDM